MSSTIEAFSSTTCNICQINTAIYCCPRCCIRTCSLVCYKQHKGENDKNCNGKRDRTLFIPLKKFSDSNLKSDFHFLEDVLNLTERGKRLGSDIGVRKNRKNPPKVMNIPDPTEKEKTDEAPINQHVLNKEQFSVQSSIQDRLEANRSSENQDDCDDESPPKRRKEDGDLWLDQHPHRLKRLVNEAGNLSRKINLLLMPSGMEKRKKNSTAYKAKSDTIFWCVEWKFHPSFLRSKSEHDLKFLQKINSNHNICILDRFSEKSILQQELSKHLKKFKDNVKMYNSFCLEDIHLFLKRLPCASNSPKYIKINECLTLQECLNGSTVIEFPTIEVVPSNYIESFPTLLTEIESDGSRSK